MKRKPHIIIFNPDQFRSDALGHLGNKAAVTPNFDRFVETDAVSFKNAFCQNPVCTPSRCSFMSGWYPHVRGHRTMYHMMQEDEPVLLKTLKDAGYFVWWGGKNDLLPAQKSFENYCNVRHKTDKEFLTCTHQLIQNKGMQDKDYYSFYLGKLDTKGNDIYYDRDWDCIFGAMEFIRNAPKDQPLCLYLPCVYPHPPYAVEDPWYSMIDRSRIEDIYSKPEKNSDKPSILEGIRQGQNLGDWSREKWKELRATYHGMCSRVDHQFGLLMGVLKEEGLYDDSAIFVFSDHGDFTGDYGLVEKTQNTFEDVLIKVPFIIKPPKHIKMKPGIRDALVELIDFPATVEELAGIQPGHTHFGRSLLQVIAGKSDRHREAVFCEGGRLQGETHCKDMDSLKSFQGNHQTLYWPRVKLQMGDGPEHGKAVMVRTMDYKYVRRFYEKDEIYDLVNDPMELHNRIEDPRLSKVLAEMKERLMDFYMETCDAVPHKTDRRS